MSKIQKNQVWSRHAGGFNLPISFNYIVNWASKDEFDFVLNQMKQLNRQTMNFRIMKSAKMIVLKDLDNNNKIVGWEGLDYEFNNNYPEVFSQFVFPEYRSFLLGVALSHACASFLQKLKFEYAYLRMESASNEELLSIRQNSKIYEIIPENEIDLSWKSLCEKCELYNKKCKSQAYLRYKVNDWVDFGNSRLGISPVLDFPARINLKKEIIRNDSSESTENNLNAGRYFAKWVA